MEYLLTLIALHHEPLSYFFNVHFMILFGDVRRPVPDCGIAPYVKSKMLHTPEVGSKLGAGPASVRVGGSDREWGRKCRQDLISNLWIN